MGRARRNQRDAIRKQRAKRRAGNCTGSDDSDEGYIDVEEVSVDRLDAVLAASRQAPAFKLPVIAIGGRVEDEAVVEGPPREFAAQTTTAGDSDQRDTKLSAKVGKNNGKPTEKERIERMRLKKQQQKARRKEKKVARETAAATVAVAPK